MIMRVSMIMVMRMLFMIMLVLVVGGVFLAAVTKDSLEEDGGGIETENDKTGHDGQAEPVEFVEGGAIAQVAVEIVVTFFANLAG